MKTSIAGWELAEAWYQNNTGPRIDVSQMTASGPITVTQNGTVIERMDVSGNIIIRADNVTVRDCRIRYSGLMPIEVDTSASGAVIEYNEIDGLMSVRPRGMEAGVNSQKAAGNITIRANYIHGNHDAIKVLSGTLVEYNYIVDNGKYGGEVHTDGVQAPGRETIGLTISRNWIDTPPENGSNGCIIISVQNGVVDDIMIAENYLNGANSTIFLFTGGDADQYGCPTDVTILDNEFGRSANENNLDYFLYGPNGTFCNSSANGWIQQGNIWYDTREAVPLTPLDDSGAVADPILNPASTTSGSPVTAKITTNTTGASIRYTTDGSTPTSTHGTLYTGSLEIASTSTVRAVAYKAGLTDSGIGQATYTIADDGINAIIEADGTYHSTAFESMLSGDASFAFELTLSKSGMEVAIGFSRATVNHPSGFIGNIRIIGGFIDVRDSSNYVRVPGVTIETGQTYLLHFEVHFDVPRSYSVFLTPQGGEAIELGSNLEFRPSNNTASNASYWVVNAAGGTGTVTVANLDEDYSGPVHVNSPALGRLFVPNDPWVYAYSISRWIYIHGGLDALHANPGGWIYFIR